MLDISKYRYIALGLLILTVGLVIVGCSKQTTIDANLNLKGVAFSPKSTSGTDFTDFFTKANQVGNTVVWIGDWQELVNVKSAPYSIVDLAANYNLQPVVIVGVTNSGNKKLIRPLDDANTKAYLSGLTQFLNTHKVPYLGIGVEVNLLFRQSPTEFNQFVNLFKQAYEAAKKVSPQTKIFTVFQLEQLKGLRGGLFGGKENTADTDWNLIDSFSEADMVGFTSYPCLVFKDPTDIPNNYYSEIRSHTSKGVIFSEIGWFRNGPQGWDSSADEQAHFITKFNDLTKTLDPKVKIWSFLYDQQAPIPFDSMGLLSTSQMTSASLNAWSN